MNAAHAGKYEFKQHNNKSYISRIDFLCDGNPSELLYMGCRFEIRVHFKSEVPLDFPLLGIVLYDSYNTPLLTFNNKNYRKNLVSAPVKDGVLSLTFPSFPLMSGRYSMDVYFANLFSNLDIKRGIFQFNVEPRHFLDTGEVLDEKLNKFFIKDLNWSLEVNN